MDCVQKILQVGKVVINQSNFLQYFTNHVPFSCNINLYGIYKKTNKEKTVLYFRKNIKFGLLKQKPTFTYSNLHRIWKSIQLVKSLISNIH